MSWTAKETPWCEEHWADAPHTTETTRLLLEAFVERLAADGMLPTVRPPGWLTVLREQHYPLCCFIGEQALEGVIRAAQPNPSTPRKNRSGPERMP